MAAFGLPVLREKHVLALQFQFEQCLDLPPFPFELISRAWLSFGAGLLLLER